MEARFEADREQIKECIATWQSSVQAHFLDQLEVRQGLNIQVEPLQTTNIITTDGDPFVDLSDELKLLLRADSLFYYKDSESSPTGHTQPETYRSILVTQGLIELSNLQTFSHDVLRTPELDQFLPYPEAQEIARMLLVLHYVRHRRLYLKVQEESQQLTDDGVIYNDIHSPEIQPSRPMTKFCLVPPINYGRALLEVCRLCRKIEVIRGTVTTSRPEMVQHLLDVHGIRKPKVKEHYTTHILPGRVSRCDEYGFPLYDGLKR
ncbi:unnamed protein product [Rhizoctonia solani]|uniref:Uncharacterized protein n=1 Tax=Rhizoctonia solani TaxID=456999 RepID=A0A8H3DWN8_9AGAM|nr:unnamed protein product [Rhizoctonia solani]